MILQCTSFAQAFFYCTLFETSLYWKWMQVDTGLPQQTCKCSIHCALPKSQKSVVVHWQKKRGRGGKRNGNLEHSATPSLPPFLPLQSNKIPLLLPPII